MTQVLLFVFLSTLAIAGLYYVDRPQRLLFAFIAMCPVISLFWSYKVYAGLSVIDVVIGAIPVIFLAAVIKNIRRGCWIRGRFFRCFLLCFSAILVPTALCFLEGRSTTAIEFFLKFLIGFASYQIVLNFVPYRDRAKLIKSVLFAVSVTMLLVLFQLASGQGVGYSKYSYLVGFYADEGTLSRMALFGILVGMPMRGLTVGSRTRLLRLGLCGASLVVLSLAVSRGAILAALGLLMMYAIIERRLRPLLLLLPIGACVFLASSTIQSNVSGKFGKEIGYLKGHRVNPEGLGSGRIGRWKRTIQEFSESDLVTKVFGRGIGIGPHGQFFDLLRRSGLCGVLVFSWFFGSLTVFSFRALRRHKDNIFASYAFLLVVVFLALSVGSTPLANFFLLAMMFACVAIVEKADWIQGTQTEGRIQIVRAGVHAMALRRDPILRRQWPGQGFRERGPA